MARRCQRWWGPYPQSPLPLPQCYCLIEVLGYIEVTHTLYSFISMRNDSLVNSTFSMFVWSELFELWRVTLICFLWPQRFSIPTEFPQGYSRKTECLFFDFTFSGFAITVIFLRTGHEWCSIKNIKDHSGKLRIFMYNQMSYQ